MEAPRIKWANIPGAFGSADEHGVANVSGGQHCRAEFYLAGFGWVPVDSADVAKMRLAEKNLLTIRIHKPLPNTYSVTGKQTGLVLTILVDFDLYPQPELAPLNNFGYPYAEIGGDPLNSFDPKEFKI